MQAIMLTKCVLFVGFGLEDDNFHRLYDAVRKARGTDAHTASTGGGGGGAGRRAAVRAGAGVSPPAPAFPSEAVRAMTGTGRVGTGARTCEM